MLAAARPDRDQNPRGKFRPLSTPAADHRRALLPASPPSLAFRKYSFATAAPMIRLRPVRLRGSRQTPADQAAFADRLSTPESLEAKFSARPGRARFLRPGSSARWRVQYRELISTRREQPRAGRVPAVNQQSSAGDVAAQPDCAAAAKSSRAVCVRP